MAPAFHKILPGKFAIAQIREKLAIAISRISFTHRRLKWLPPGILIHSASHPGTFLPKQIITAINTRSARNVRPVDFLSSQRLVIDRLTQNIIPTPGHPVKSA